MIFSLGKKGTADDDAIREETFKRWREASERIQPSEMQASVTPASRPGSPSGSPIASSSVDSASFVDTGLNEYVSEPYTVPSQQSAGTARGGKSGAAQLTAPTLAVGPIEEIKMDSMRAVEWPEHQLSESYAAHASGETIVMSSIPADGSFDSLKGDSATIDSAALDSVPLRRSTVTLTAAVDDEAVITPRAPFIGRSASMSSASATVSSPSSTPAPSAVAPSSAVSQSEASDSTPRAAASPRLTPSKLAQFVSNGLNAARLMGGGAHSTPARGSSSASPTIGTGSPSTGFGSAASAGAGSPRTGAAPTTSAPETHQLLQRTVSPIRTATPPAPAEPLTVEEEMKRRFGVNIRSALGPGTIIEGTFSFDSPVCIEGTLIGEVKSNSLLVVGAQASVKATVKVGSLVILGNVQGDVEAETLVEIRCGGNLEGDVRTERIAIEAGGWLSGRVTPMAPKKVLESRAQSLQAQSLRGTMSVENVSIHDDPVSTKSSGAATGTGRWSL